MVPVQTSAIVRLTGSHEGKQRSPSWFVTDAT
jgi:hypothetical protein